MKSMDISLQNPRHCITPNISKPFVRALLYIAFASVKLNWRDPGDKTV